MNITPKLIGYEIHRILVAHQVTPGCSIPLQTLMQAWTRSALRRPDLGRGLEALRKDGCIAIEQNGEGTLVRLVNESFSLVTDSQDQETLMRLQRLRELRKKPVSFVSSLVAAPALKTGRRGADREPGPVKGG